MNIGQLKLEPVFDFTGSESNILIHQCKAEVSIGENTYTGDGEVRLELLPRANIYLYGYFKGISAQDAMSAFCYPTGISSFSINGRQIKGFLVEREGDVNSQDIKLKWCPRSQPITGVGDESTEIIKIIFHLFNFVVLSGNRQSVEQCGTKTHEINHIDLTCDEWKIELKSLLSVSDNIKILKRECGYQLTHVGAIEKVDGTAFSGKYAYGCLTALRFFLSFARGKWCEPVCAVGFNASGNRVWESWSSPSELQHEPSAWFDPDNSAQLTALYPIFMGRWKNEDWCEALREIIYWYQNANQSSRGIDAGIILTQAAIERLSYEYSVKDKRLLTVPGFKDLRASDKFRLLFSSLGITLEISKETPEMEKLAQKQKPKWLDAPHALTEIRNSLVHCEHKKRGQLNSVYYEAWNLGLWYLEMGILAICGYSGTYVNRLKQLWGQVEDVPWAKENNKS